jgi:hypothetical protein
MSDKPKAELDYAQIRDDVASAMGQGTLSYTKGHRPPQVRVSLDRVHACRRVNNALFADDSLSILSACVAEGVTRGSYRYACDAGLI